jgi:hypothetical protein
MLFVQFSRLYYFDSCSGQKIHPESRERLVS